MISSLKKASCSEATALQSTKALTRFWCGLLTDTWRRRGRLVIHIVFWFLNRLGLFVSQVTMAFLRGRGTQMRVGEGEGDGVGGGAWLRPELLPTRLQYSSSWLLAVLGGELLFPRLPPPLLVRRYDVVFSELHCWEISRAFSEDKTVVLIGIDATSSEAAGGTWLARCGSEWMLTKRCFETQN